MEFHQRNIPPEPGTPDNEKETDTIFPSTSVATSRNSNTSLSSSSHSSEIPVNPTRNNPFAPRILHTPPSNLDECKEQLQSLREKLRSQEEESLTGLFIHSNSPQNPFLKGVHGPAFLGDSTARFIGLQFKFEVNSRIFILFTIFWCYAFIHLYRLLLIWIYEDITKPSETNASSWRSFEQSSSRGLTFILSNQILMFMLISSITYFPFIYQLQFKFRAACFAVLLCLLIIAGTASYIFATKGYLPNTYFYVADIALLCSFAVTNAYFPLIRARRPNWFRDIILYVWALFLTAAYIFLSPFSFYHLCLRASSDSIRIIFAFTLPLVTDIFLAFIRTSARVIQLDETQTSVLHSITLPIYAILHIMIILACLCCRDMSMVALASIISCSQITFSKYVLFYRDLWLNKFIFSNTNMMSSKAQIRFTADFTMLEHMCQLSGMLIATIIFLVFNLLNESTGHRILKSFVCFLIHSIISQIPVLCVCGCSQFNAEAATQTTHQDATDVEVPQNQSWTSRAMKTAIVAIRRRHCDFVNVWCSKHDDFRKHFLYTVTAVSMTFVRILFDPSQLLCLEHAKRFVLCA